MGIQPHVKERAGRLRIHESSADQEPARPLVNPELFHELLAEKCHPDLPALGRDTAPSPRGSRRASGPPRGAHRFSATPFRFPEGSAPPPGSPPRVSRCPRGPGSGPLPRSHRRPRGSRLPGAQAARPSRKRPLREARPRQRRSIPRSAGPRSPRQGNQSGRALRLCAEGGRGGAGEALFSRQTGFYIVWTGAFKDFSRRNAWQTSTTYAT